MLGYEEDWFAPGISLDDESVSNGYEKYFLNPLTLFLESYIRDEYESLAYIDNTEDSRAYDELDFSDAGLEAEDDYSEEDY